MKRTLALLLVILAVLAAACESKEKEAEEAKAGVECTSTPSPIASPSLPSTFPSASGVVYTATTVNGPSTVVTGFASGDLEATFESYKSAMATGGYSVTKSEKDPHDAEVNFSGNQTTGQVKLGEECKGRTSVSITVRPA